MQTITTAAIVAAVTHLTGRRRLDAVALLLLAVDDRAVIEDIRDEVRALGLPTRLTNDLFEVLDQRDEALLLAGRATRGVAA